MVLIGTGCAITGIKNVIDRYRLNRDNYLLIGLLCDKLMSYRVWDYFTEIGKHQGKLQGMYFRDKSVGGWPGGVKLRLKESEMSLPKRSRAEVKDLFCHPPMPVLY